MENWRNLESQHPHRVFVMRDRRYQPGRGGFGDARRNSARGDSSQGVQSTGGGGSALGSDADNSAFSQSDDRRAAQVAARAAQAQLAAGAAAQRNVEYTNRGRPNRDGNWRENGRHDDDSAGNTPRPPRPPDPSSQLPLDQLLPPADPDRRATGSPRVPDPPHFFRAQHQLARTPSGADSGGASGRAMRSDNVSDSGGRPPNPASRNGPADDVGGRPGERQMASALEVARDAEKSSASDSDTSSEPAEPRNAADASVERALGSRPVSDAADPTASVAYTESRIFQTVERLMAATFTPAVQRLQRNIQDGLKANLDALNSRIQRDDQAYRELCARMIVLETRGHADRQADAPGDAAPSGSSAPAASGTYLPPGARGGVDPGDPQRDNSPPPSDAKR